MLVLTIHHTDGDGDGDVARLDSWKINLIPFIN